MYLSQSTQYIYYLLFSIHLFHFAAQFHTTYSNTTISVTSICSYVFFFLFSVCLISFAFLPFPPFLQPVYIFLLDFISMFYVPSFYTRWQTAATGDPCEDISDVIHNCNEVLLQRCSFSLSHDLVWF